MAENKPEKDEPEKISPRRGAIELLQVGSVLLIPIGWVLRFNPWLTGAAWALALVLFWLPFRLVKAEVEEAESEKARLKAEKTAAEVLRSVETKEPTPTPTPGMEVPPYHSSREGTKVYHIFADCFLGNDIEKKYRTDGMGDDTTLCDRCEQMKRERERRQKPAA